MAETSGFFNARLENDKYDRSYTAENFAEYFASFVGNGIFQKISSALLVAENTTPNMSVRILPGMAFINGYWYKNSDPLVLSVEVADGVYGRIDSVVARYDYDERVISVIVKTGAPAPVPVAPQLQRNNEYYELELAQINVSAGIANIRNQNIVDTRSDNNVCGWVQAAVQSIDTTYFGNQLNQFITRYIAQADLEFEDFRANFRELLDQLRDLIDDDDALGQLIVNQGVMQYDIETNERNIESLQGQMPNKENRYERVYVNVSVDYWTLNEDTGFWEYSFEDTYPSESYDIEIDLDWDNITQDQIRNYSRSGIVGSHVINKLVARSKQPTLDYPMMLFVTYRGAS